MHVRRSDVRKSWLHGLPRYRSKHPGSALYAIASGMLVLASAIAISRPCIAADLTYLVHAPTIPVAHPPLIVLLHGSGADENDMIGLWRDLPEGFVVISPRAPFGDAGQGYRWYRKIGATPRADDLALSRKIVDLVVENAIARFHADPARIFLAGFSQGAIMVYEVGLREPDRFRGAAVLSGSLFASATPSGTQPDLTHAAFFIAHGSADARIPAAAATSARATLARLGVPTVFHLYLGMGHDIGAEEKHDLEAWLSSRLEPAPQ